MLGFFKTNLHILIFTVLVAVISGWIHIYGLINYKTDYSALGTQANLHYVKEETYAYAAQVQQLLRGSTVGDSYIWEYDNTASPYLGEIASIIPLAILSKLSNSVSFAFIAADFIFPALLFLLIYTFLKRFSYKNNFSIVASLAVVITPFFSMLFPLFSHNETVLTGVANYPIFFTRTPHPQISSIFLFLNIFLTSLVLTNQNKKLLILWILTIIASFYSSIYVSSTVIIGSLLVSLFFFRRINISKLLPLAIIFLISVLPWAINYFNLLPLFQKSDFILRSTFEKNLIFPLQLRYIFLGGLTFIVCKKSSLLKVIFLYILAAAFIADAHQIIISRNIEADHWISRILAPITTLSLFLLLDRLISNLPSFSKKLIWPSASLIIILFGLFTQISYTKIKASEFKKNSKEREVLEQINSKTVKNNVIGAGDIDLNNYISGASGRFSYLGPGDRTLASSQEQSVRVCDLIRSFEKVGKSDNINKGSIIRYILGYQAFKNQDMVDEMLKSVKTCSNNLDVPATYKLDYLLIYDEKSQEIELLNL